MKKANYISPTVELTELEVEMGIATSTQTMEGFNDIYLEEEDVW